VWFYRQIQNNVIIAYGNQGESDEHATQTKNKTQNKHIVTTQEHAQYVPIMKVKALAVATPISLVEHINDERLF
jgi:hypothetical protein